MRFRASWLKKKFELNVGPSDIFSSHFDHRMHVHCINTISHRELYYSYDITNRTIIHHCKTYNILYCRHTGRYTPASCQIIENPLCPRATKFDTVPKRVNFLFINFFVFANHRGSRTAFYFANSFTYIYAQIITRSPSCRSSRRRLGTNPTHRMRTRTPNRPPKMTTFSPLIIYVSTIITWSIYTYNNNIYYSAYNIYVCVATYYKNGFCCNFRIVYIYIYYKWYVYQGRVVIFRLESRKNVTWLRRGSIIYIRPGWKYRPSAIRGPGARSPGFVDNFANGKLREW